MNKKETIGLRILDLEMTNRCNLNCPHCYFYEDGEKGTDYDDFIKKETIDKIFDDIGNDSIMNLNISGGEPLLAKDEMLYLFDKILEKKKVFSITITTNGTILDEDFAYKIDEFSRKFENLFEENEDKRMRKYINEYSKIVNRRPVYFRISDRFHDNEPEKAYDFFSNHMPHVSVGKADNHDEDYPVVYSGRAKKLNCDFRSCDSAHHKVKYEKNVFYPKNQQAKCPIKFHWNGNISISAYVPRHLWDNDLIGSVFDGKSLKEMFDDWNYRVPLTCDEACELAQIKMAEETGNELKQNDGTVFTERELNIKVKCLKYLEKYRLALHEKVSELTPAELEDISLQDIETLGNDMTEDEKKKRHEQIDNQIAKMIWEHKFDDVKEVHEEFSYLLPEECAELLECYKKCEPYKNSLTGTVTVFKYLIREMELISLNEKRKKNGEGIF